MNSGAEGRERLAAKYRDTAVVAHYDAARYDHWMGRLNNRRAWTVLRNVLADLPHGATILDVPTGTGRFAWHLARQGWHVLAADVSNEMLSIARSKADPALCSKVTFVQADIFHLPYADAQCDAAVCVRLFNLLDRHDRIAALRELQRVAKTVVVSYYHPFTLKFASRWLRSRLRLTNLPAPVFAQETSESKSLRVEGLVHGLFMSPCHSQRKYLLLLHHKRR